MFRLFATLLLAASATAQTLDGAALAPVFQREVDRRLEVPLEAQARYAQLLEAALASDGIAVTASQYVLLLDRSPQVQALFVYWLDASTTGERLRFIGASPASTGLRGHRGYFITPLGVFAHTLANRDFRSEGTFNKLGVRGFGRKGMRLYDFGWVLGERGWGRGGESEMRLLMHATDPDYLEPHLGTPWSKGCIRIPAALDDFIDRYGLLDADYEQGLAQGKKLWVLRPDRKPTPWSGRYLVVVDSGSTQRPLWSPGPQVLRMLELADPLPK